MNLFEAKTGKFTPLSADQLAKLNADQRSAYDAVALAVEELNEANAEAVEARSNNQACVQRLDAAEAADKAAPKWSALDEWKASLRIKQPVSVVAEQPSDTKDAQIALTESHTWLRSSAERQSAARGAVALAVQRWQVANGGGQTPGDLVKEHIANENKLRAERVASGQSRHTGTPGPSVIDRYAFATRGARGRQTGPQGQPLYNFRRGGQGQNAELGRRAAAAAAARPKLPSER